MFNSDPTPGEWLLHDIRAVAHEVLNEHSGLLSLEEKALAREVWALDGAEGRLWARLVGRQKSAFLVSSLNYTDVPNARASVARLVQLGLVRMEVAVSIRLGSYSVQQLRALCKAANVGVGGKRSVLVARLRDRTDLPNDPVVGVRHKIAFQRLEWLCFRRWRGTRSDWVRERMGTLRLPSYELTPAVPLFASRQECLEFERLRGAGRAALSTRALQSDLERLAPRPSWLSRIDPRRIVEEELFHRARELERTDQRVDAMAIYGQLLSVGCHAPGRVVQRLSLCLEQSGDVRQGAVLCAAWRMRVGAEVRLDLERTGRRLARKSKTGWRPSKPLEKPMRRKLQITPWRGSQDGRKGMPVGSLEDAVVRHLHPRRAIFGENSLWRTLFALFFYDLYWLPVHGMLPVRGLSGPLDLGTPGFANARISEVRKRMLRIREGDFLPILNSALVHRGERVQGLNWNLASNDTLRSVATAVGARTLMHIFGRMLWKGRVAWRGFPDLLVLEGSPIRLPGAFPATLSGQAVFVEVKGPGDTLSGAQRVWMDYLIGVGARVEVWDVVAEEERVGCGLSSPEARSEVDACQAV